MAQGDLKGETVFTLEEIFENEPLYMGNNIQIIEGYITTVQKERNKIVGTITSPDDKTILLFQTPENTTNALEMYSLLKTAENKKHIAKKTVTKKRFPTTLKKGDEVILNKFANKQYIFTKEGSYGTVIETPSDNDKDARIQIEYSSNGSYLGEIPINKKCLEYKNKNKPVLLPEPTPKITITKGTIFSGVYKKQVNQPNGSLELTEFTFNNYTLKVQKRDEK